MNIIEELQENWATFARLLIAEKRIITKAYSEGKVVFLNDDGDWEPSEATGSPCGLDRYRLTSDYKPEPEWSNRIFASTCDREKDGMNNVVGVTAHCKCGNVFVDDVAHGKAGSGPHTEKGQAEPVKLKLWRKYKIASIGYCNCLSKGVYTISTIDTEGNFSVEECDGLYNKVNYTFELLPEPKIVECKVFKEAGLLMFENHKKGFKELLVHAVNDPNFVGYKYKSGNIAGVARAKHGYGRVADIPTHVLFLEE